MQLAAVVLMTANTNTLPKGAEVFNPGHAVLHYSCDVLESGQSSETTVWSIVVNGRQLMGSSIVQY